MNLDELRNKILNHEVCRLCLEEESEMEDIFSRNQDENSSPEYFIRKFNLIEVKNKILAIFT